jgi:hypothetical protein
MALPSASPPPVPAVGATPVPFAGFDRLNAKQVIRVLSDHSQAELTAVENFERANQGRKPVLDKLRFMRQPEPMPGYDALSSGEVVTALEEADMNTLKRIRGYERKFANRPDVSEAVVRTLHERRSAEPAAAMPSYVPTQYG